MEPGVTVQWQKKGLNSDLDEKVLPLCRQGPPLMSEFEWVFMLHP
jgi:hypothetical protein